MTIWLDMDGTIADLYGVDGWLEMLRAYDATPYEVARPLVNMNTLARLLNNRQRRGYRIGIISALSKSSTPEYDEAVKNAKLGWLRAHLASVRFDEIRFIKYTDCKNEANEANDILVDDEVRHLTEWKGVAIPARDFMDTLRIL